MIIMTITMKMKMILTIMMIMKMVIATIMLIMRIVITTIMVIMTMVITTIMMIMKKFITTIMVIMKMDITTITMKIKTITTTMTMMMMLTIVLKPHLAKRSTHPHMTVLGKWVPSFSRNSVVLVVSCCSACRHSFCICSVQYWPWAEPGIGGN